MCGEDMKENEGGGYMSCFASVLKTTAAALTATMTLYSM
jgi:hypothetical protein